MTLEEAIKNEEEAVEGNEKLAEFYYKEPGRNTALGNACRELADERRQLAAWLKELKKYREWLKSFNPDSATECFTAVRELRSMTKKGGQRMSKVDVVIEVLLEFLSPATAIGSTEYDDKAYRNLKDICYVHDYCYDLIKDNAELIGNEYSVKRSRECAIKHLKESIENMTDLLKDLEGSDKE